MKNPLRWQEIYNEKDAIQKQITEIKANIESFEKKIDEYSNFKQQIFDLKYPKITVELNEETKVEPKADPTKVDPVVDPKEDPVVDPKKDPVVDPKKDPVIDPKADPVKDPKADPVKDPKVDPVKDPKVDPVKDPKVDPKKDPKPTEKVDLKDVKFIIGKNGLTVKAPGLNKEDGLDELTLDLRELKDENYNWESETLEEFSIKMNKFLTDKKLTEDQLEKIDPNILTALSVLYNSDVNFEIKKEMFNRYADSISNDGKVPADKSLKGIIEYDRTDLDYLKPRNIFSRIIHKKQFDEMKQYADIAEEMGIADVKQDKPGWIRQFISNMNNKVKLLASPKKEKPLEKTKEYKEADEAGKDLLSAMEEHRKQKEGRVEASNSIKENNGKIENVYYDKNESGEIKKVKTLRSSLYNPEAAAESNKKHEATVVKSDGDVLEKPAEEEVK